jgi:hypothetical protein
MYANKDEFGKIIYYEPGSRDSGYFKTYEEASKFLGLLDEDRDEHGYILRNTP